jgi:hypothetical protein
MNVYANECCANWTIAHIISLFIPDFHTDVLPARVILQLKLSGLYQSGNIKKRVLLLRKEQRLLHSALHPKSRHVNFVGGSSTLIQLLAFCLIHPFHERIVIYKWGNGGVRIYKRKSCGYKK